MSERQARLIVAGVAGFGGALLPYLLPPKTWRAARKLEQLRIGADTAGFSVGYGSPSEGGEGRWGIPLSVAEARVRRRSSSQA